ncbi:MAG: helix-turn-helix domain-containing protein [Synergistaceae bacterium]|nr:helix-turn-helix domain-containing protein [Synergistaceae bacterium]
MDNVEYVSSAEAAMLINKSQSQTQFLCRTGRLDAVKVGNTWIIKKESLLNYSSGVKASATHSKKKTTSQFNN